VLNKIEELLPMITDEIVQWNWFRDSNKFESPSDDFFERKDRRGRIVSKETQITEFRKRLSEIEKILPRLEDSKLRFQAIRERAPLAARWGGFQEKSTYLNTLTGSRFSVSRA
jgi:hypothetical protein